MSWPYPEYEPQIVYLTSSNSWLCRVRKPSSSSPVESSFRSLEGPKPPIHATPQDALDAAKARIEGLNTSKQEALAVEVVKRLTEEKLRPIMISDPDNKKGPKLKFWEAQLEDGTWTEPQATPYGAVKVASSR